MHFLYGIYIVFRITAFYHLRCCAAAGIMDVLNVRWYQDIIP